jgi:hypothetical protein
MTKLRTRGFNEGGGVAMKWAEMDARLAAARQYSDSKYESPIEEQLGDWLLFVFDQCFPPDTVSLIPQYEAGRYRYDFAIKLVGETAAAVKDQPIFLIECDGLKFHSTPEQIINDKNKDAFAREISLGCLRYRGTDIWRNVYGIAIEIAGAVEHVRRWAAWRLVLQKAEAS